MNTDITVVSPDTKSSQSNMPSSSPDENKISYETLAKQLEMSERHRKQLVNFSSQQEQIFSRMLQDYQQSLQNILKRQEQELKQLRDQDGVQIVRKFS